MSFESGSVSFRMYHLVKEIPEPLHEGFLRRVAPPLDTLRDQAVFGWVTGRYLLDRKIDEQNAMYGGWLRMCLLQAERKIPASLLRAEVMQEELVRLAVSGNEYLSRKEKQEVKQEIMDRLLPTMPPQLKGMTFVHRPGQGELYAETLSEKQVDVFTIYLREAIGFTPEVMMPETLALRLGRSDPREWMPTSFSEDVDAERVSPLAGHDFMTWLWFMAETHPDKVPLADGGKVGVMLEGPLTLVMEGGGAHETSLRKGNPLVSAEAKACLAAGKKLRKATVNLVAGEQVWRFGFDAESFAVRGLKPAASEGASDPVGRFQDRMVQVETVKDLLLGLYGAFLKVRASGPDWEATVKEMRTWIRDRNVSF